MKSKIRYAIKKLYLILLKVALPPVFKTKETAAPITVKNYVIQKLFGINRKAYWPTHFTSVVSGVNRIKIGIGTAPGLSPGCYIQGGGKIYIGDYTIVAPNVGIISANHDIHDLKIHTKGVVRIGNNCWIGMNSIILPNVELGDFTVVGAGSVVTKSFPEGYCVIGGNPAKVIRKLRRNDCIRKENFYKYYGYIPADSFDAFRAKHLEI